MLTAFWQSLAVNCEFSQQSCAVCNLNFIDRNSQFEVKNCQIMASVLSDELTEYNCESRLFFFLPA
jgi:hypothetical protein